MNPKGLLCLKWHQSCTKTACYHFFLLSGFLWASALDFPGPIFLWTMLLLQQTWTFWHKWKWNTKRCPAGAAARRRLGVSRSFRCRLKITFGSSRTSCKCQVCKEILYFNGDGNCSQRLCSLCQNLPIEFWSLRLLISVKWVGVGKSRESIIKLFWSLRLLLPPPPPSSPRRQLRWYLEVFIGLPEEFKMHTLPGRNTLPAKVPVKPFSCCLSNTSTVILQL